MRRDSNWKQVEQSAEIIRAPDSDKTAFLAVLKKLGDLLQSYFRRKGLQPTDAEELGLEALEKIVLNIEAFCYRGEGSFVAWCLQIAKNHWKNWVRGRGREFIAVKDDLQNTSFDAGNHASESTAYEYVWQKLKTLSPRDQEIIGLRVFYMEAIRNVPNKHFRQQVTNCGRTATGA